MQFRKMFVTAVRVLNYFCLTRTTSNPVYAQGASSYTKNATGSQNYRNNITVKVLKSLMTS